MHQNEGRCVCHFVCSVSCSGHSGVRRLVYGNRRGYGLSVEYVNIGVYFVNSLKFCRFFVDSLIPLFCFISITVVYVGDRTVKVNFFMYLISFSLTF